MADRVTSDKPKSAELFPELSAEGIGCEVSEIESLCMRCYEQGMTRLLLTKIPFFREVIISSFHCEACGHSDRGVQSGSKVQERGVCYTLNVTSPKDFNRQIVKSDYATLSIPVLEFEQPASRRGEVTTIEGLFAAIEAGLLLMQDERRKLDPDGATKVEQFVQQLVKLKEISSPFKLIIDDPSGNSFIENPLAPAKDEALEVVWYTRSRQQDIAVGCAFDDTDTVESTEETGNPPLSLTDEVLTFPTNCSSCNAPCDTNMKMIDIPFFKQAIVMATTCNVCGKRDNEVKSGTGIEPQGIRITLRLTDISDLSRDILKSDTCAVRIPELELELVEGTLGGKFTTIEGLLTQILDQLSQTNPFVTGDSSTDDSRSKLQAFCNRLQKVISGEMLNVHLILDDPAGNSYMQNVYAPEEDPEMKVERYERSFDQNELLGLNDMKTENYAADDSRSADS